MNSSKTSNTSHLHKNGSLAIMENHVKSEVSDTVKDKEAFRFMSALIGVEPYSEVIGSSKL